MLFNIIDRKKGKTTIFNSFFTNFKLKLNVNTKLHKKLRLLFKKKRFVNLANILETVLKNEKNKKSKHKGKNKMARKRRHRRKRTRRTRRRKRK